MPDPFPFVPVETIRAAQTACHESQRRFAAGDRSVTSDELAAYGALLAAVKTAGVNDPFGALVDRAMDTKILAWRFDYGPLGGGRKIVL